MKLTVALLQTNQVWEDADRNLADAARSVRSADAELAVLPEMFPTGFSMNAPKIADPQGRRTKQWFRDTARTTGKFIIGSAAVSETAGRTTIYKNRLFYSTPNGDIQTYDKAHLFRMGGEHEAYLPGESRLVVECKGIRIMPVICYDLRFPVWLRNRGDYDAIVNTASWAQARRDVWLTLLKARAIENVCYTVGVNRVGDDPAAHYSGDSVAYDFRGKVLVQCPTDEVCSAVAELDTEDLGRFRTKFPVHLDADGFTLSRIK